MEAIQGNYVEVFKVWGIALLHVYVSFAPRTPKLLSYLLGPLFNKILNLDTHQNPNAFRLIIELREPREQIDNEWYHTFSLLLSPWTLSEFLIGTGECMILF